MSQLVSCSKNISTYNINSSDPVVTFNPHQSNVNCAIWNHNNQVIASCGNDGQIFLSHSQKSQVLLQLMEETQAIPKPISSVSFTSNSQFLASAGQEGVVKVWDLKKRAVQYSLKGHFSQVNCVHWNNTDSIIASCSNAGEIILHDISTQIQISNFSLNAKTPGFKCVRFQPLKKSCLVSGSNDGSLTVWDVTLRDQVVNFPSQHSSKITAIACSIFNENLVCSSGIDQKVNFYDIGQKSIVKTLQCDNPLTALAFHNDGHSIAIGTLYGSIYIYDLRQTSMAKKQLKAQENSSINYLEFVRPSEEERQTYTSTKSQSQLKEMVLPPQKPNIKDENTFPLKTSTTSIDSEKQLKIENSILSNKQGLTALEEIKRETLQRIEQSKDSKRVSSQKPPQTQLQTQFTSQTSEKNILNTLQQRDSAAKNSQQTPPIQPRSSLETYTGKIEDLSRKYEKMQSTTIKNADSNQGFSEEQKRYLQELLTDQFQQMKHYVSDQIGVLHIDMIRQFQIQQNDFQSLLDKYLIEQNQLQQRINQLEQQNQQLRRTTY